MISRELTRRAGLSQRVSADLGAAFARAGLAEQAPRSLTPRGAAVAALRPDRRWGRPLAIGMGIAAGVAGLALGAFVIRPPPPPGPPRVAEAPPSPPQTASLDKLPPAAVDPTPKAEASPVKRAIRASARGDIRPARAAHDGPQRIAAHPALW